MPEGFMNWIKCSERKPRIGVAILFVSGGNVSCGLYYQNVDEYYDAAHSRWTPASDVTCWIYISDVPLPQPPEE